MARATSSSWHAEGMRRLVSSRVRHREILQAERQRSMQGELRVAVVLADAGLGKTRLATELLPRDVQSAVGLTARTPFCGVPQLGPWMDALGLTQGPDADCACRVCGSGLGGLPALGPRARSAHDPASCVGALRHHFVEWVPRILAEASARRPIMLVLEDVHRAEDAVWEMLLRLARDCRTGRVLVVATARPAELAARQRALEMLHALEQDTQVRHVDLAPFTRQELRELSAGALGRDQAPTQLVDWLMSRAQGNPRFTVGLLEALAEREADPSAPVLDRIPDNLTRWVRAGLAQLDPTPLALLELLAVTGDSVDPDHLVVLAGLGIDEVARALEQLAATGAVIEQQREGALCYTLPQALIREVLYSDMGGVRRRVLHRRVATALLESGRIRAAGRHYVEAARAGDGQAVSTLVEMARHAQQRGLDSLAWQLILSLQDLLPGGDPRWCEVFEASFQRSMWGTIDRTVHYVDELDAVRRMRHLLVGTPDQPRQAEARLGLAGVLAYGAGDVDAGEKECLETFALCRRAGWHAPARLAAIEWAKIRGWAGDLRGEESAARRLLQEAERCRDQRGVAEALAALAHALGWQGRFSEAETVLLRSVEVAENVALPTGLSHSLALLAMLDACRGQLVSARARYARAAGSSPPGSPMIGRCGTFIELIAGDLPLARAHAQHAQRSGRAASIPVQLAGWVAIGAAEGGAVDEARRHLHILERLRTRRLGIIEPLYWWAEGVVARTEGRFALAVAALNRSVEGYATIGGHALSAFVLADLAEVTAIEGDRDAAADVARRAEDLAWRTEAPLQQALHLLARACTLLGCEQREAAAHAASDAVARFSSRGYRLLAARSQFIHARAVHRSDRKAAQETLREAAATFEACGAIVRREQARALLRQVDSQRPCRTPERPGLGSLTRRERQVSELAARGYTASHIAGLLHIGVRTVETHLARSYRKLGVTKKQQLVHHAAELGFVPSPRPAMD